MGSQVAIPVVQAHVCETITLEALQASMVHVTAGVPFRIVLSYQIEENSLQEDVWRFRLTGIVPGESEALSQVVVRDRRLVRDNVWSHLSQEHVCPVPGEYALRFEAEAEMTRRPWNLGGTHQRVAIERLGGEIRLLAGKDNERSEPIAQLVTKKSRSA